MLMIAKHLAAAALALTLFAASAVAQGSPWLHVEVRDNGGDKSESVNVNVPFSMARIAMRAIPQNVLEKTTDKLKDKDINIADLREMWTELRNAGDAELVTVDDADQTVRIVREGDRIRVRVQSKDEDGEKVSVDVPVSMVDALFSGTGDELDFPAAMLVLESVRGDVVNVTDKDQTVRVWIDERS